MRLDLLAHFLPRPPPEPLSVTTGKEDEVTSSEEASTVDVRIESKGMITQRDPYDPLSYAQSYKLSKI